MFCFNTKIFFVQRQCFVSTQKYFSYNIRLILVCHRVSGIGQWPSLQVLNCLLWLPSQIISTVCFRRWCSILWLFFFCIPLHFWRYSAISHLAHMFLLVFAEMHLWCFLPEKMLLSRFQSFRGRYVRYRLWKLSFFFRGEFRVIENNLYYICSVYSVFLHFISFFVSSNATKILAHSSLLGCLIYQVVFGFFLVNHKASGH